LRLICISNHYMRAIYELFVENMSGEQKTAEQKVSRRRFIGYIAAAAVVAGAAAAGATYYLARPPTPTATAPPAGYVKKWPTPKLDLKKDIPYVCAAFIGLANPWDELNRIGAEWYCKDVLGWNLEIVWPEADVKRENDGVEMAIKKGVDGIVACPLDSLANAKIGEMAMNADIPLVEFGIDMYHSWPLAMYQRDDYDSGKFCALFAVDELVRMYGKAEGKALHIHGYRGSMSDFLRSGGWIDVISQYPDIQNIEVANSWVATAEYPKIKAAMAANPDLRVAYEEMGGFHECVVTGARELGWPEKKIQDLICVNCDLFPVNIIGYEEGTQDYCHMMPTGPDMLTECFEQLREFWKKGAPDCIPPIGEPFTFEKYLPEMQWDAEVDGFKPLQFLKDPVWGIAGSKTTNKQYGYCPVKPAPCGGPETSWVVIPDRIITREDYKELCIYWNWPIWGLKAWK